MSVQVYNFKDSSGTVTFENGAEANLYLAGQTNCEACIVFVLENGCRGLYNFICDKEHMKNMIKSKVEWFDDIVSIDLNINKVSPFLKSFIEWGISQDVKFTIRGKPF